MSEPISVSLYLRRIGADFTPRARLEDLQRLVLAHANRIPFESLTPFSGHAVTLDLASLQRKLVLERRGGYCFEHNLVLQSVLQQIGFDVIGLAARVVWNASGILPRTHMALLVLTEAGHYVVDVGFGGLTLTGALRLDTKESQSTPHETFRLRQSGDEYVMEAAVRGEWRALYRFDLQPQMPVDYVPVNWYLSTHAESRFVQNLLAARVDGPRRLALLNREFTTYEADDKVTRIVSDLAELRTVLEDAFLITVPPDDQTTAALQRLFE